jgi:hypothetical protein
MWRGGGRACPVTGPVPSLLPSFLLACEMLLWGSRWRHDLSTRGRVVADPGPRSQGWEAGLRFLAVTVTVTSQFSQPGPSPPPGLLPLRPVPGVVDTQAGY